MTARQLKLAVLGGIILVMLLLSPLMFGINNAGERTVIQYPTGTLKVKFDPGLYMQWFGSVEVYKDVITFDFDKEENEEGATIDQEGISVRYQDGGTGTIYGIARLKLPNDLQTMIDIHKEFRSNDGIAYKLIKAYTEDVMNHTAGLMTSEESYAEKRGIFSQWARDQLQNGKFLTKEKEIITTEAGYEYCLDDLEMTPEQKQECRHIKKTRKRIPVIYYEDGMPKHTDSDIKRYGLSVTGFQIVDWGYEPKTLKQIAAKREATMAIITAKANAEKAKQDAITAEQQGIANVTVAKYEKEVEKTKAIVDAEKNKEIAIIEAQKRVEVAEQAKLEAEQKKLAAAEYKQEQILRGEGDAEYKRLVMEADGALAQKLEAYKYAIDRLASAVEKQKWVPEIMLGGSGASTGDSNAANQMIQLLMTKTAQDLKLDIHPKK